MIVEITAKMAMFCDPCFKTERVSYPVPTPSAIAGCLRSVYAKPEMEYVIDEIRVINRPKFILHVQRFLSSVSTGAAVKEFNPSVPRNSLYLKDVRYFVRFHVILSKKGMEEDANVEKHEAILRRRLLDGQFYLPPYVGTRECAADVRLVPKDEEIPDGELKGIYPLPVMTHSLNIDAVTLKASSVNYYRPVMRDGVINCHENLPFSKFEEGGMLKNLLNFYEMHGKELCIPRDGFMQAPLTWRIKLDENGTPLDFSPIAVSERGKPRSVSSTVPLGNPKSSNVEANFLWGGCDYAFGWGDEKRGNQKRTAFVKKLSEVASERPADAFFPILDFYANFDENEEILRKMASKWFDPSEAKGAGNVTFETEGGLVIEDGEAMRAWGEWFSEKKEGERGFCLVTGEPDAILAEGHALIKNVKGGSNMGRLISVDSSTPSLWSWGKESLENCPISADASFELHAALNWMLGNEAYKQDLADGTIVFWTRSGSNDLQALLKSAFIGTENSTLPTIPDGEPFYFLWLRPNGAGRVFVAAYERFVTGEEGFYGRLTRFLEGLRVPIFLNTLNQWEDDMIVSENQGYLLGQLFAQIRIAQMDSVPSTVSGGGIEESYYNLASARPEVGFPRLLKLLNVYLKKADYGIGDEIAVTLKKLEGFDHPYPKTLLPNDRAMFAHGFAKNLAILKQERWERIKAAMETKEAKKTKKSKSEGEEE
jgi:CRISPR-associated protein Cas5d